MTTQEEYEQWESSLSFQELNALSNLTIWEAAKKFQRERDAEIAHYSVRATNREVTPIEIHLADLISEQIKHHNDDNV